jgi:hypothetical protein
MGQEQVVGIPGIFHVEHIHSVEFSCEFTI